MAHVLISGTTESGKSTLARQLAAIYSQQDIGVIVIDPINDPRWGADFQTTDQAAFLQTAKNSWHCALFVDEGGEVIGRYNDSMFWCATQARHRRHRSHFIVQRPALISPTVRTQCTRLVLFASARSDAKILAEEWNCDELLDAPNLQRGEFFDVSRFGKVERGRVF